METLTPQNFWKCIKIFLRNYHVINKNIFACKIKSVHKIICGLREVDLELATWQYIMQSGVLVLTPSTEANLDAHLDNFEQYSMDNCEGYVFHINILKKNSNNITGIGVADCHKCLYICKYIPNDAPDDDLCIRLQENQLKVHFITERAGAEQNKRFCKFVLQPKLLKWCQNATTQRPLTASLQLIDSEAYNNLYKELKLKYATAMLQLWSAAGESTDPYKFIYEDIAIASYLICLWQSDVNSKVTAFADLGCGNGLLVYILNAEGYAGYGYDVRARRLWSHYPAMNLIEQTIQPENCQFPPEVDWLIGNHSDELSPWLPVLAATASPNMRYFLLPCCAYEFSGCKFQRRNSNLSVYADFLEYAKEISDKCGYKTLQDRLKIPSTKRIAIVGIEREHLNGTSFEEYTKVIWNFVHSERCAVQKNKKKNDTFSIKLREQSIPVRNCTKIDRQIIDELVVKIFNLLMEQRNSLATDNAKNEQTSWFAGEPMRMCNIVQNLPANDLKHIKNECGGIKTLLRNKHEIFEFHDNDFISIRRPKAREQSERRPQTVKKRTCFFQKHHPNGCPLTNEECTFIHS